MHESSISKLATNHFAERKVHSSYRVTVYADAAYAAYKLSCKVFDGLSFAYTVGLYCPGGVQQ
jgi:hypothetical protein